MEQAIPVTLDQAVTMSSNADIGTMGGLMAMLAGAGLILLLLVGVLSAFSIVCFFRISKKVGGMSPWMQLVPVANAFYYFQLSGLSYTWLLVPVGFGILSVILPPVGALGMLVFMAFFQMSFAARCGRNKWFGLLLLVPIVNLWALWKMGAPAQATAGAPEASVLSEIERIKNMSAAEVAQVPAETAEVPAEPVAVAPLPAEPPAALTAYEQQQVQWLQQCIAGGFEKGELQQTLAEQSQVTPEQFEKLWTASQQ